MSVNDYVNLEKDVLAMCLRDKDFVSKGYSTLSVHKFIGKTHAWIWEQIARAFNHNRERIHPRALVQRIERAFPEEREQEAVERAFVDLWQRGKKIASPGEALDELHRLAALGSIRRTLAELEEATDEEEVDEKAREILTDGLRALGRNGVQPQTNWFEEVDARAKSYLSDDEGVVLVPTPFPRLNKAMGGGIPEDSFSCIVADPNVGKSGLCVQIGATAIFEGGAAVIHITTEESIKQVAARYDSYITDVDRKFWTTKQISEEDVDLLVKKVKRHSDFKDRLMIQRLVPTTHVVEVRTGAQDLRERNPGLPIIVIVDSADHLITTTDAKRWDNETAVYWFLKALAGDKMLAPIAIWTTTWKKQAFVGKSTKGGAGIAGTLDKSRILDFLLDVTPSADVDIDEESDIEELVMILEKTRFSEKDKKPIYIIAKHGTCSYRESFTTNRRKDEE